MGITNAGLAEAAGLLGDTGSPSAFTYLALGSGDTAFAATQTALVSEITDTGLERASATVSRTTTTVTNDTLKLTHQWTATGDVTVKEAGVFNAASSGDMLARKVLDSSVTLANTDTYTWTHNITLA